MPTTRQRRETARRRLERQIQRRQQASAARKRRNLVTAAAFSVLLVLAAVFLVVTQLDDDDPAPTAAEPTASASGTPAAAKGDCTYTKSPEAATKDAGVPPNGKVPTTGTTTVSVVTTQGPMTFTLDRAKAPCTVNSFLYLAEKKYFDDTPCHRVTTGAQFGVLQCGDPGGTGAGGPGYSFGDELDPNGKYTKGVLAMANSGANTNGSQFFIVYKDTQLPVEGGGYSIFGRVTKGLDLVTKVAAAGVDQAAAPKPAQPVDIQTVSIAPKAD